MIKRFIPNLLTSCSLLTGCIGIMLCLQDELAIAGFLIGIAAVFDFLDGLAARALNATSEIGKQLDSLSDLVSFGVLPGIIMFQMISISLKDYWTPILERSGSNLMLECVGLLITVFSALRLAKFNLDTRQSDSFRGLPVPANAIFMAAIPIILSIQFSLNMYYPVEGDTLKYFIKMYQLKDLEVWVITTFFNTYFLIGLSLISCFLLVSDIPLLALKFKNLSWAENKVRYIYLICVAFLGVLFFLPYMYWIKSFPFLDYMLIPIIVILYIVVSLFDNVFSKKKQMV